MITSPGYGSRDQPRQRLHLDLRPKEAPDHITENWLGTSWIAGFIAMGMRVGKPFQASHLFLTSLRMTPEAQLQLLKEHGSRSAGIRDACCVEPGMVGLDASYASQSSRTITAEI